MMTEIDEGNLTYLNIYTYVSVFGGGVFITTSFLPDIFLI